jgi:hypothetical protein
LTIWQGIFSEIIIIIIIIMKGMDISSHRSFLPGTSLEPAVVIIVIIIIIVVVVFVSCHTPFRPGTSLEPAMILTSHPSSFTLQYFPYYVCCSKYSCLLY